MKPSRPLIAALALPPLLVAVLAYVLPFIVPAPFAWAAETEHDKHVFVNNFKTDLAECPATSQNIREVAIDDLNIDVRETTTGADWDYRVSGPGAVRWGNVKLGVACTSESTKELQQWMQEAAKGKNIRKNITVTLFKRNNSPGRGYNLIECAPLTYSVERDSSTGECLQVIVVKPTRIDFVAHGQPAESKSGGSGKQLKQASIPIHSFRVELSGRAGGKEVDTAWESVSGGELVIDLTEPTTNSDKFQTNSPGHKTVGEITLRGAMTDGRKALSSWINETVDGKQWKRNVTVTGLGTSGGSEGDGPRYDLQDALPIRYQFPKLAIRLPAVPAEEKVGLRVLRNAVELPSQVRGRIDIPGAPIASRAALLISIDDLAMDVAKFATSGDARNPSAVIAIAPGQGAELQAWFQESLNGRASRKNIVMDLHQNGQPTGRRYNLLDCFPTKYDAGSTSPNSSTKVETLVVRIGRVDFVK